MQKSRGEKIANKKKHQPQLRADYDTIRASALHTHFIELASKFPDALFSLPLRFLQAHEPEQRESNASADPLVQPLDYTGPCVEPLGDLRAADVGQFFFQSSKHKAKQAQDHAYACGRSWCGQPFAPR